MARRSSGICVFVLMLCGLWVIAVSPAAARCPDDPCRPTVRWSPDPSPTGVPQDQSIVRTEEMGLAWPNHIDRMQTELDLLKMQWFLARWSPDLERRFGSEYVPITRCGLPSELAGLPSDYSGYLIVFNEPNMPEPYGCPLSTEQASARYRALRQHYPLARTIVGNASVWELGVTGDWMLRFASQISDQPPYAWGVHAYDDSVMSPAAISAALDNLSQSIAYQRTWITETGVCSGNTAELSQLLRVFKAESNIERIAFYTDEQPMGVPWGVCEGRINLLRNGSLTDIGTILAAQ